MIGHRPFGSQSAQKMRPPHGGLPHIAAERRITSVARTPTPLHLGLKRLITRRSIPIRSDSQSASAQLCRAIADIGICSLRFLIPVVPMSHVSQDVRLTSVIA